LIILQGLECFRRQRDQCDHIEHCHQSHAQISQIPDKLICGKSSDKKHNESQHFIQRLRCPVIPKEVCHIRSCVEQDTQERRETEQKEDHCNEYHAELPEMVLHGGLEKIHSLQPLCHALRRQQHDHGRTAADHKRVDKDAQRLKQSFLCRMADVRCRRGAGCGT